MRYLAININYKLDQNWYYRCNTVLECYNYFDRIGPGRGPRTAIYDTELNKYLWIDEEQSKNMIRINAVVYSAVRKVRTGLYGD